MEEYNYETQKEVLTSNVGMRAFIDVREHAVKLARYSGAVRMDEGFIDATTRDTTDTWTRLACADKMVELGELREIATNGTQQGRVFVLAGALRVKCS